MRIIVLGADGMLGHVVAATLSRAYDDVVPLTRKQYGDLSEMANIDLLCDSLRHAIVINCVGMIRQRLPKLPTADGILRAIMLNSYLPHRLAEKSRLIHVSSDCIFSGRDVGNYVETDLPDEPDIYGRSKALGEPTHSALVLRTSIIGPELSRSLSLFEWFMAQESECNGFTNSMWNGVTTTTLADCILLLLQTAQYRIDGVRHVFGETVSKYDLLMKLNALRASPLRIRPTELLGRIDRTLSTIFPDFNKAMPIPPLDEQIDDMRRA